MAPEVVGGKAYNSKADIWALGVTFWELITLKSAASSVESVFDYIQPSDLGSEVRTHFIVFSRAHQTFGISQSD
jgi:serine/threonine protein kinase